MIIQKTLKVSTSLSNRLRDLCQSAWGHFKLSSIQPAVAYSDLLLHSFLYSCSLLFSAFLLISLTLSFFPCHFSFSPAMPSPLPFLPFILFFLTSHRSQTSPICHFFLRFSNSLPFTLHFSILQLSSPLAPFLLLPRVLLPHIGSPQRYTDTSEDT